MPSSFSPDLEKSVHLRPQDSWPEAWHRFDQDTVWALQTALSIGRPLLLRGEPGIGKSQLARAAAQELGVPFLYHVVDERCERDDLMHSFDAVARLAEAQVSALSAKEDPEWRKKLAEKNFIRPGVLWWAFSWKSAAIQAETYHHQLNRDWSPPIIPPGWSPDVEDRLCGPVVLIDEIDKADPSVPNGLLECLGNEGFQTAQLGESIRLAKGAKSPLILITTNEERELPAAFLRRCLVLHMEFPKEQTKAIEFLERRASGLAEKLQADPEVIRVVAECIVKDRSEVRGRTALPGASEFLELLKALINHGPDDREAQLKRLKEIQQFVLRKHDPFVP